jgi:hypothetical protein
MPKKNGKSKTKWVTPKLTVIVRGAIEEKVLASCKQMFSWSLTGPRVTTSGPADWYSTCGTGDRFSCWECSASANS